MITIFQAEMAGTLAGMSSGAKREVPSEHAFHSLTREAWLDAFDHMRQSLRGTPVEAPKGAKDTEEATKPKRPRKARQMAQETSKVVDPEEVEEEPVEPKTVADILAVKHHEAKEYA